METSKNESAAIDQEDNMNEFQEYEIRNGEKRKSEIQEKAELNKELPENEFEGNVACEHETMDGETCTGDIPEDEEMQELEESIQSKNAADEEQSAEPETKAAAFVEGESGKEDSGQNNKNKNYPTCADEILI